jgi:hypothetical protein
VGVIVFGIAGLSVIVAITFVVLFALSGPAETRARRSIIAAGTITLWMIATALAAKSGLLRRFDLRPPPMAGMFLVVIGSAIALGTTLPGRMLAEHRSLALLVGVQSFRLPLELVMHQAGSEGVMPVEMSFSGYNFDILTGLSAIVVAILLAKGAAPRWLVAGWNAFGLLALSVIAAVAFLSSPMLRAFGDDPRHVNTWVCDFPFVWLPAVLVVAAIFGHIVIARRLLRGAE